MDELKKTLDEIVTEEIVKIIISNPMNKEVKYKKITFVLKENKGKQYYYIEKFTDKQAFHENIETDILEEKIVEFLNGNYKQLSAWSHIHTFDLKISKKGKVFLGKKKSDNRNQSRAIEGDSGKVISNWLLEQKSKNIFFAPGPVITKIEESTMKKIFSTKPILHLNKKEALDFTEKDNVEDSILALYKLNRNNVIITMGCDGTVFYDGNEITEIQGEKVKAIDTNGAGDSHIGTIISAYSIGYDFKYACKLANKVAAQVVQVQGTKIHKEFFDKL